MLWQNMGRGGKCGGDGWTKKHLFFDKSGSIINEAVFIYWHEYMAAFIDVTPSDLHDATLRSFH